MAPKALMWIPDTTGENFPYDAVKRYLETLAGLKFRPKNFSTLIESGIRIGWNKEVITEYKAMGLRGRCLDFSQRARPCLRGTLFETSVFFNFDDEQHEAGCSSWIEAGAKRLGLRILER